MQNSFLLVLVGVNMYFLVTTVANIIYFRRATMAANVTAGPAVSVIVPARDEERSIARCIASLLGQDYDDFEVIVVDDGSSDATAAIVSDLAKNDARLQLVSSGPLPSGWMGKPRALCRGAATARGEILLLTDADTVHEPHSISWAVTNLNHHHADMVSGYLRQEYTSLGECIVVPSMYAMMMLVPLGLIPRIKSPRLSFAIGQYVALRSEALRGVGGFESIREALVDDMTMATRMKQFGYRTVFLDAKGAARCHLYSGYRDAFSGIMRSVYSALGATPLVAVSVAALVLAVIVGPAFTALASNVRLAMPSAPVAISVLLFAVQWALLAWDRDMPFVAFALYPLVFLNLVFLTIGSMATTGFGRGVDWKGRTVRVSRNAETTAEADWQTPERTEQGG